jgi:KaiC/GvpD/RAD55 family RecA-like ATPase
MLADTLSICNSNPIAVARLVTETFWGTVAPSLDPTIANTGIRELDEMLKGGFRHPTTIALVGPRSSGRSTLGARFQEAALKKQLPGLYITYSHSPLAAIRLWDRLGIDALEYARQNLLRIFDPYSALHNISKETLMTALPSEWHPFVDYVDNPVDPLAYMDAQVAVMKHIGTGGINVIDTVNARFDALGPRQAAQYFSRMKNALALGSGQTAIHIVDDETMDVEHIRHVALSQDGLMRITRVAGAPNRFRLTIDFMSTGPIAVGDRQYTLGRSGIIVIPEV